MTWWMFGFCLWASGVVTLGNPPSASQPNPELKTSGPSKGSIPLDRRDLEILEKTLRNDLAALKNDFDRRILVLEVLAYSGFGLLGISYFLIFSSKRKLIGKIEKEVETQLEHVTGHKLRLIQNTLHSLEWEQRLQKDLRILIVSDNQDTETFSLLEKLGFRKLQVKPYPSETDLDAKRFAEIEEASFDLVLLDGLGSARINAFVALSAKPLFVAYSPQAKRIEVKAQDKINFANSPMTLYTRIIEAVRYGESLKP